MTARIGCLGLLTMFACKEAERPQPVDDPTTTTTPEETGSPPVDTATTTDSGVPATTLAVFDCATVPATPTTVTKLEAPRGYNDLVFDLDGAMIGGDSTVLWRATDADTSAPYTPALGRVYKMGLLPGGDVVATRSATDGGGVVRVTPDGGITVLLPGLEAYGLAVASNGSVWVALNYTSGASAILRLDPDTGEAEIVIDAGMFPPRAIAFGRDETRLYIGTQDGGQLYAQTLDAALDPVGEPELVATLPSGWHDTVEVDACGNVYVGSFFGWAIFRVAAVDGAITELMSWTFDNYGHGFEWGSAEGGWNEQAIYMTHPYIGSRVDEIVIGVPSAQWVGEVVGGAAL